MFFRGNEIFNESSLAGDGELGIQLGQLMAQRSPVLGMREVSVQLEGECASGERSEQSEKAHLERGLKELKGKER